MPRETLARRRRRTRGLSVRDVEASLADALGAEVALSKSTVSRVCEAIDDEFETWKGRDLSEVSLEYLLLDGSHFKMYDGARAEPVLAAWGVTTEGRPVLVGLDSGASEFTDARKGFWDSLVASGLRSPLLVDSDGAAGLIGAVELVFRHSLRQRCAIHRYRNTLAKVPVEHHKRMRHSNFIERTFGETRRRVRVIGRLPGERSCLGRVWAVLDRTSRGWRGVTMTPAAARQLQELRRQLLDPPTAEDPAGQLDEPVSAVA